MSVLLPAIAILAPIASLMPATEAVRTEGGTLVRIAPYADEVVGFYGDVPDRPRRLAELLDAEWQTKSGERVLVRTSEATRRLTAEDNRLRVDSIAEWLRRRPEPPRGERFAFERVRKLQDSFDAAWKAQYTEGGKALEALRHANGVAVLLRRLLNCFTPETLVRLGDTAPVFYSDRPNAGELPLPPAARAAIDAYLEDREATQAIRQNVTIPENRRSTWRSIFGPDGPDRPYGKLIVTFLYLHRRTHVFVSTFDNAGRTMEQAGEIVDWRTVERNPSAQEETLLSELGDTAAKLTPESHKIFTAMRDPTKPEVGDLDGLFQTREPVAVAFDPILSAVQRKLNRPLVARISDYAVWALGRAVNRDEVVVAEALRTLIKRNELRIDERDGVVYLGPTNRRDCESWRLARGPLRQYLAGWRSHGLTFQTYVRFHGAAGYPAWSNPFAQCLQTTMRLSTGEDFRHEVHPAALGAFGRLSDATLDALLMGRQLEVSSLDPEVRRRVWAWASTNGINSLDESPSVPELMLAAPESRPGGIGPGVRIALELETTPMVIVDKAAPGTKLVGFPSTPTPAEDLALSIAGSYGKESADDPLRYLDGRYFEADTSRVHLILHLASGVVRRETFTTPTRVPNGARSIPSSELSERYRKSLIEHVRKELAKSGG